MTLDPTPVGALPGAEIVINGVADLAAGRRTVNAAATAMASARLRAAGLEVGRLAGDEPPAHQLYDLLAATEGDAAHSRYNAIARRVLSFARALERA